MNDQDDTQKTDAPVADIAPKTWPHLLTIEGSAFGQVFRITHGRTIIGRGVEADIQLPSLLVSRQHAAIVAEGDRLSVEDLRSRNGTFVDFNRVGEPQAVVDGSSITVGDTTLLKLTCSAATDDTVRRALFANASKDPHTNVASKWSFIERLHHECAVTKRHNTPLALVFFRIGRLVAGGPGTGTEIDRHRHLRAAAAILQAAIRTEDMLTRSADDELAVLARADEAQAVVMAERLRALLTDPVRRAGVGADTTISAAVVPIPATTILGPEMLLVIAGSHGRVAMVQRPDRVSVVKWALDPNVQPPSTEGG